MSPPSTRLELPKNEPAHRIGYKLQGERAAGVREKKKRGTSIPSQIGPNSGLPAARYDESASGLQRQGQVELAANSGTVPGVELAVGSTSVSTSQSHLGIIGAATIRWRLCGQLHVC